MPLAIDSDKKKQNVANFPEYNFEFQMLMHAKNNYCL